MNSPFTYVKLLFANDEQLLSRWNQLSNGKDQERYRGALAKELKKRDYHSDGGNWVKSSA